MTKKKKKPRKAGKASRRVRQGDPFLVVVDHRVRFKTESPVSVEAAIASLRGLERIVSTQLPKAILAATGARVKEASLQVSGLEDGSFLEDLKIKLLFKTQADYDEFVDKVAGVANSAWSGGTPMMKLAIGVLVASLVVGGLYSFLASDGQSGALSNIQGDNNAVIVIGAEAYNTSPEEFQKAIDKAISKTSKKRGAQSALDATAPAREQGVGIEFESERGAEPFISKETATSLPRVISKQDVSEDKPYRKVRVKLRASDYDSAVKGWAGTVPGIVEMRTRIIFANEGDAAKAAFKPEVEADISVTYATPLHDKAILIVVERIY